MKQIYPNELEALLYENAPINIIDVREADEVQAGKIPNAMHIPLGLVEFKMQDLDNSKEYIMVCRSGGRSFKAATLLKNNGFNVINMPGGMIEWNGPTE
jgi:rhodanese-related sulfurtransferase